MSSTALGETAKTLKSFGTSLTQSHSNTIPALALVVYGDQDLSILDEMPPNRQKILTRIVPEKTRRSHKWITELEQSRPIIFPLIEESEMLDVAATKEFDFCKILFFHNLSGTITSNTGENKDETMQHFAGQVQYPCFYSVVEVGSIFPVQRS